MGSLPQRVAIVEVGPRDGLQNESTTVPTPIKAAFIEKLADAGLTQIEATSFVHPKLIPQLADAEPLLAALRPRPGLIYSALVPNARGLARAVAAGVKRIAVFAAASESFTQKNIGMSIADSLSTYREVVGEARRLGMSVRGYVSTAFGCPYEGNVSAEAVRSVTAALLDMGADQVAVSDTIGVAVPTDVITVIGVLLRTIPADRLALHFHDTNGTALANVYAGLTLGISTFDSSAGGLGGCPFAPGAAGNLATEDLVHLLENMGIATGVDGTKVLEAASILADHLHRPMRSAQWRRCRASS